MQERAGKLKFLLPEGCEIFLEKDEPRFRGSKGEKVYEKVFFFKNNYSIKNSCVKSVMKF